DWRGFGFTTGGAGFTCLFFGFTPALRAARGAPAGVMKSGGRGVAARREGFSPRRTLVVSPGALSPRLVVGGPPFPRSPLNLMTLDAGFAQDGVLEIDLNMAQLDLPVERRYVFKRELLDRVRAMPGVEAATSVSIVPLDDWWNEDIFVDSNRGVEKRQANFN